jgi:hypothetical protein
MVHGSKDYRYIFINDFWTSGYKSECTGNYSWCSLNDRAFSTSQIKWKTGEPSNGTCVYLANRLFYNESYLATDNCDTARRYICEVNASVLPGKNESKTSFLIFLDQK